jgi:hypothetical protein
MALIHEVPRNTWGLASMYTAIRDIYDWEVIERHFFNVQSMFSGGYGNVM